MSGYTSIKELKMFTMTLSDGREMLLAPFRYRDLEIPAGFTFDGASTPRLFWSIIPPFKLTKKPACVHDWLCRNAKSKEDRKKADKLWKEMLKEEGLNPLRVYFGYLGVRIGAHLGVGNNF